MPDPGKDQGGRSSLNERTVDQATKSRRIKRSRRGADGLKAPTGEFSPKTKLWPSDPSGDHDQGHDPNRPKRAHNAEKKRGRNR